MGALCRQRQVRAPGKERGVRLPGVQQGLRGILVHVTTEPALRRIGQRGDASMQHLVQRRVIGLTPVVRIDQAEVQRFTSLINIRHAGCGKFDNSLAQTVYQPGLNKRL